MTDQNLEVKQEPTYEDVAETDVLARPFRTDPNELSTNFYWVSKAGYNLQTTIRGNPTETEIHAHLEAVVAAAKSVVRLGGQAKAVGQQPQATARAAPSAPGVPLPTPAPEPANGRYVAAPAPDGAVPAATAMAAGAPLIMIVFKMEVTPMADRVRVNFYAAGHKWPDIGAVKSVEQWLVLLGGCGPWQVDHFKVSTVYELARPYRITYHLSEKLNYEGNPYKDIDQVDLAQRGT